MTLASELGQKYATQNYPGQGTPICKLHGPSIKPRTPLPDPPLPLCQSREEQGQFPFPRPSGFPPRNFLLFVVRQGSIMSLAPLILWSAISQNTVHFGLFPVGHNVLEARVCAGIASRLEPNWLGGVRCLTVLKAKSSCVLNYSWPQWNLCLTGCLCLFCYQSLSFRQLRAWTLTESIWDTASIGANFPQNLTAFHDLVSTKNTGQMAVYLAYLQRYNSQDPGTEQSASFLPGIVILLSPGIVWAPRSHTHSTLSHRCHCAVADISRHIVRFFWIEANRQAWELKPT